MSEQQTIEMFTRICEWAKALRDIELQLEGVLGGDLDSLSEITNDMSERIMDACGVPADEYSEENPDGFSRDYGNCLWFEMLQRETTPDKFISECLSLAKEFGAKK